jgi:hypothetical protein
MIGLYQVKGQNTSEKIEGFFFLKIKIKIKCAGYQVLLTVFFRG